MSDRRYYDRPDDYRGRSRERSRERDRGDRGYGGSYDRHDERDRDRNGRRDDGYGYSSSRYDDRSRSSHSSRYESGGGYGRERGSPSRSSYYESSSSRPYESSSRSYDRSRYEGSSSRKSSYDYDSYDSKSRASSSRPYYEYEASSSKSSSRPYDSESQSAFKIPIKSWSGKPRGGQQRRPGGGGGGGGFSNRRGNRAICDLVVTRPATLNTKKGTSGSTITLLSNYFKIMKKPDWNIYKYKVDFIPDVELLNAKKTIMRRFITKLGSFQFDGSMIFSPYKFQNDPLVLVDKDENDVTVQVSIKHVGELKATDGQYLHLLNLIMRATIESLNMQSI